MHRNPTRPMSPFLTIWKWGPHMLVSILHRVTGTGLATLGAALFVWWLVALAGGPEAYAGFAAWVGSFTGAGFTAEKSAGEWIKYLFWAAIGIGLAWALFQHMLSGIRHLVMDLGAGYELRTNRFWAVMTVVGALLLTALAWSAIILGRMA
jgi:succinate dehydrogenase / fumarate reductase cytochrome b subunit